MYTVRIEINNKKSKKLLTKEFSFSEIDTASYRDQMNAAADFLSVIAAGTMPLPIAEILIAAIAGFTVFFAKKVYDAHHAEAA